MLTHSAATWGWQHCPTSAVTAVMHVDAELRPPCLPCSPSLHDFASPEPRDQQINKQVPCNMDGACFHNHYLLSKSDLNTILRWAQLRMMNMTQCCCALPAGPLSIRHWPHVQAHCFYFDLQPRCTPARFSPVCTPLLCLQGLWQSGTERPVPPAPEALASKLWHC